MRVLFVGGAPRSGTSFLQRVLDVHPGIIAGPEFDHIPTIINLWKRLRRGVESGRQAFYLTSDDVDEATRAYVYRLFARIEARYSPVYLSEKTPANTLVFEDLAVLFPDARFIYIERDPGAVVASLLRVGERARAEALTVPDFTRNLVRAAAHTREYMEAGREFVSLHAEQSISVTYEDLVRDPLTVTNQLYSFLDLTPLSHLDMGSMRSEHSLDAKLSLSEANPTHATHIWYQTSEIAAEPNPNKITRWRTELPGKSQAFLNWYFRDCPGTDTRRPPLNWRIVIAYETLLRRLVRIGKRFLR